MLAQPKALVKVPELVGLPIRKAKLLLENVGLKVEEIIFQESYDERGTVLVQKPSRGQMVYVGEKIVLHISRESYLRWMPGLFDHNDASGKIRARH